MYRMAVSLQLACIHHNAAKQQPKTAPDALGMHHRDTEERRFDKFGIGTWARIGSSMSRLLAEGMVGESMVTDAFAPKARVSPKPLDCKTPNTPWCLCASVVNHFFRFRCSLERRVKNSFVFQGFQSRALDLACHAQSAQNGRTTFFCGRVWTA
jgi:hypothetical protein